MTAVAALTERMVRSTLHQDLPFAILVPAGQFIVFNFALQGVIDTGTATYSQYLLPVIIIQFTLLAALTTVEHATRDQQSGFGIRLRTLPIPLVAPLIARMLYCLLRGTVALAAAIAVGYIFGFRMTGGLFYTVGFAVFVLAFTLALSLGADATGTGIAGSAIGRNGTASQVLLVPQMLLVMMSTGMAPADAFPDWVQPFVVYQPISQIAETLRGFASGHVVGSNVLTSVAWCLVLLAVFGVLAVRAQRRTE
ncbi:ABC transporter permease [Mycolicibacterium sp. ELW1]|uniref:ABC transporter permease n=1 Tax=Mycobacteriaceae TaxID=1762 RepID=UPI002570E53E|nr:ABC transporter permease [Mycobacterium sp. ELW1]